MTGEVEPRQDDDAGSTILHRKSKNKTPQSWRTWLIGTPLPTADAPHETIGKLVGLAVFAGDALSSIAYAPQETLLILAAAGADGFRYAVPISLTVTFLLVIVTISYVQTIHAYPGGGGAYTVARENLGELSGQVAGAALLIDYVLLAAVAVSSGTAQLVSAWPELYPYRVSVAIGIIGLITLANLRGVRESGTAFSIPIYFFLVVIFLTIGVGFFRLLTGTLGTVVDPPVLHMAEAAQVVSLFLILKAFANGTTALTGVETVSNGVTAFREPRSHNASLTLIWMASILGVLYLGITFLLVRIGAVPSETETVISQLARTVFDSRGLMYLFNIAGTTIILVLATNTAFAGFPRLSAVMAADGFLPHQLSYRGSRLVYSRGIVALGGFAAVLVFSFQASVTALVPLWAIGVFLSFTLSQLGMARRWWKNGHPAPVEPGLERTAAPQSTQGWRLKWFINGFGAVCTALVTAVFAVTKFVDGAWIVLVLIPIGVFIFVGIHRHYLILADNLSLRRGFHELHVRRHRVILPISGIHQGSLGALNYALALSTDVTAVYVSIDPEDAESVRIKWEVWGKGVRLVILDSPYRLVVEPLLDYIEEISRVKQPNEVITIVVPQFVPRAWWHNLLHAQTATWLRLALLFKPGIVVTDVPYQVK